MLKRIIELDKRFLQPFLIMFIVYTVVAILTANTATSIYDSGSKFNIYLSIILLLVIIICRVILNRKSFFNQVSYYYYSRSCFLFIYAYFIMEQELLIQFIFIIIFLFTIFELVIIEEPVTVDEKQKIILTGILPIILQTILHLGKLREEPIHLLILFVVIFSITEIVLFLSYYTSEKVNLANQIERQLKQQRFKKESLELERVKYKKLNKQMYEKNLEIEKKNEVLNRFSAEIYTQAELLMYISAILDIEELTSVVADAIIGALGLDTCMLVVYNKETGHKYYNVTTSSANKESIERQFIKSVEKGCYRKYLVNQETFIDLDVDVNKYTFIVDREIGSLLIMPLVNAKLAYGFLIAEHKKKGMFDEQSVHFFRSISSQIAIAVNNANMYSKMEEMAITDGLTGLFNRRKMQKKINEYLSQEKIMSLALFDIDKFKKVNDTYGHLFGDEVIISIAAIAKEYAKTYNGFAGRYGGEEFVIALPGKDLDEAEKIIQAFHQSIQDITFMYEDETEVTVNVSIGLSVWPKLAEDTNTLLSRADNAMYYAKQHGRGRLVIDYKDFGKVI